MLHTDFELNHLTFTFAGKVPDAVQRVRKVLAPLRLVALVDGALELTGSTQVEVIVAGTREGSAFRADSSGNVVDVQLNSLLEASVLSACAPATVSCNETVIYGNPLPEHEEAYQDWEIFAGVGLRPEHLVIATVKNKDASWSFWEAEGCGFARYTRSHRYPEVRFPRTKTAVARLQPDCNEISVEVTQDGQSLELEFSDELRPLVAFPSGSEAEKQCQLLWNDWLEIFSEKFEQLGKFTGDQQAAVALEHRLQHDAGIEGINTLLDQLGISRAALDYALSGEEPEDAQKFAPRGLMDRVRMIGTAIAHGIGPRDSLAVALWRLLTALAL